MLPFEFGQWTQTRFLCGLGAMDLTLRWVLFLVVEERESHYLVHRGVSV